MEAHLDAAHEPPTPAPYDDGVALEGPTLAGDDGVGVGDHAPPASYALPYSRDDDEHLLLLQGVLTAHAVRDHYDGGDEHLPLRAVRSSRYGVVVRAGHALLCLRDGGHGHSHVLVGSDDRRGSPSPLRRRSGVVPCHGRDMEGSCGRVPGPRTLLGWLPGLPSMGLNIVSLSLQYRELCELAVWLRRTHRSILIG